MLSSIAVDSDNSYADRGTWVDRDNWNVVASWRNQENAVFPFWCKQGSIQRFTDYPRLRWIEK